MLVPNTVVTEEVELPILQEKGVGLYLRRLDRIHPMVSGNKFFKLKYNIAEAKELGMNTLLTFGGAFSNHIHAVAAAGKILGLRTIGVIRGEQTFPTNPTLKFALESGMTLHYVDRESYRNKTSDDFLNHLRQQFGEFFLIPEGGTNSLAIRGTSEILGVDDDRYSHLAVSIGTGGTFAGIASSLKKHQTLMGFSSLKGEFIHQEIADLLEAYRIKTEGRIQILDQYHFGGYGKHKPDLLDFLMEFYEQTGTPLDPVYTGKMMFGLLDQVKKGKFEPGSKILAIHTGGLQGILGFNERFGTDLPYTSLRT